MFIKYIILGIIQGLTEFLPVSSSGHLVLAKIYSSLPGDMAFDVLLHLASALAIMIYLKTDISGLVKALFRGLPKLLRLDFAALKDDSYFILGLYIIAASVPAGFVGIFFENSIESFFSSDSWTAVFLIITGFILLSSAFVKEPDLQPEPAFDPRAISLRQAMTAGIFQAFAILPGISRSGTTITAAMWAGMSRSHAGRFSFLLGLPAILGAGILKSKAIFNVTSQLAPAYAGGALFSFVFSYAALIILFKILKTKYFSWFSVYCWGLGLAIIIIKLIK